jgi:serine/threonine protein phosphatase PrpC
MHKQDPKDNDKDKKGQQHQTDGEAGRKPGQKVPNLQEAGDLMRKPAPTPKLSPDITHSQKNNVSVAIATGGRSHQEDFCLSEHVSLEGVNNGQGQLMAVLDGHGGSETAGKVSKALRRAFEISLAMCQGDVPAAIKDAVSSLSRITEDNESGSTLSLVYVPEGQETAYVAVIGDSPVIILDKENRIVVSPEHNVRSSPAELERARKRGALYQNGYIMVPAGRGVYRGGLQMSRSLGDRNFASILDREPEIYSVPLRGKSLIILGTDGLFDPGHHDTAIQVKRIAVLAMKGAGAKELVQDALDRTTYDNVTAIVWRPR